MCKVKVVYRDLISQQEHSVLSNIYLVSIESDDEDVSSDMSDSDDEMLNYVLDEHIAQMLEGLPERLQDEILNESSDDDFYSSSEDTEPMEVSSEEEC